VEAALLARAGWRVRLDPDLGGSFEEGPETLLSFAKRDRRWCQGNLQHLRLLFAPGLKPWSRFVFAQGIFAYLLPVLWFALVALALLDGSTGRARRPWRSSWQA
jgi:membrane glycosyltransferase